MGISELCIRRPVLTTLVTATFIVFGIFAYRLLSVVALPSVDFPTIQVTATLPGAQRRLPIEMTIPPSFRKVNPGEQPVVFISGNSATLPISTVDEYAEVVLAQQMSQVPGVALVEVYGAQKFAVRVQVDPVAAAARNISLDDIRRVLVSTNSNWPVGTLYGPRQNITLLATSAMRQAQAYKDVVVVYRNGAPVKLQEIARVIDSVENDKVANWFNESRSITL